MLPRHAMYQGGLWALADIQGMHAGLVQPHPNCGCVLTSSDGRVLAEAFQEAQVQLLLSFTSNHIAVLCRISSLQHASQAI